MLICGFTRGHFSQFDTALYPTEKLSLWLNALFVNDENGLKLPVIVKLLTHNVAYNLNRNLWTICDLATEKLQISCSQKTCHVDNKAPFQLVFLPNAHKAQRNSRDRTKVATPSM